jgi:hypothetical protein
MGPLGVALAVGQTAWAARQHWQTVPADRRERLQTLVRRSGGRPSNLSPAERQELGRLVRELELGRFARQAATDAAFSRRRRRRFR